MTDDLRTWVADTSSLIAVRQGGLPGRKQSAVFTALAHLVRRDQLIFPPQLLEELEWGLSSHAEDQALRWARAARARAEKSASLETVRKVLKRAPELWC